MEKDLCRMEKKFIRNLELNNYCGRKKTKRSLEERYSQMDLYLNTKGWLERIEQWEQIPIVFRNYLSEWQFHSLCCPTGPRFAWDCNLVVQHSRALSTPSGKRSHPRAPFSHHLRSFSRKPKAISIPWTPTSSCIYRSSSPIALIHFLEKISLFKCDRIKRKKKKKCIVLIFVALSKNLFLLFYPHPFNLSFISLEKRKKIVINGKYKFGAIYRQYKGSINE